MGESQQGGGPEDQDVSGIDGVVVADLSDGDAPIDSSDDGDDGYQDHADGAGGDGGASSAAMAVDDDSIHSFEAHKDAVLAVAWSPAHPDLVATGGQDDNAWLWRVGEDAYESTAGTLSTFELSGHTDSIASIAFNHNGTLLATGGMDGFVKVWNTTNGSLVQTLEGSGGAVEWVRWHPKGDVVLAGTDDFSMWMWLAQSGTCMQVFSGHQGPVTTGGFTHDGKTIVSAGGEDDCSLRVWNPKSGECVHTISGHPFHEAGITCCSIHVDNAVVMTGAEDGTLMLSNIVTGRVLGSLQGHEDSVEAVCFSPHPGIGLAASGGMDSKMLIWDCAIMQQRAACQHPEGITRMAWHPREQLVFTACLDGMVRCVDPRTGAVVRTYPGHTAAVQDIALSPDGAYFVSGSDDRNAKVFQVAK